MRPWRASLPRSKQSGSMRLGSAPAQTRGRRCSSISRCFTIGSGCTQPWATALRLRRGPAWRRSPCALRRDILIYPLHTKGGGPNLIGADLVEATLVAANLGKADLIKANLNGANLGKADLVGANLNGTNLTGAILARMNLAGMNFTGANLNGADLANADLTG